MTTSDDTVVRLLRELLRDTTHQRNTPRVHEFRPGTWRPWLEHDGTAVAVLTDYSGDEIPNRGQVSRADLSQLSQRIDATDRDSLVRLFVATMLWGSGTSNGRAPRYTAAALKDERLVPSLLETRQMILDGSPGEAYVSFHCDGVGPAFFTKWFWAVGLGQNLEPTPLILDARVWASLGALGWDSREAAGSRRWRQRYVAYLDAMQKWSGSDLPGIETAEQLEQVLFQWAGGR